MMNFGSMASTTFAPLISRLFVIVSEILLKISRRLFASSAVFAQPEDAIPGKVVVVQP
jgi:hypothetical protein